MANIRSLNIFHFALSVLNFFSVPSEDECLADDGLRSGLCMNVYECKMQGGKAKGDCALGFGVCCVCKYNFFVCSSIILATLFSSVKFCRRALNPSA